MKTPSEIISKTFESTDILLNVKNGEYFSVNPIAGELWKKITAGQKRDELIEFLINEYEISKETATSDLEDFLQMLKKLKLLAE